MMKIWKLVSGVLSIVFCLVVMLQSCAAGVVNTLESNGEVSGSAGALVAVIMLAMGIVSIAVRKSKGKGGNVTILVLGLIAALIGFANYGSYGDLVIWSAWCLLCAILALVCILAKKKDLDNTNCE